MTILLTGPSSLLALRYCRCEGFFHALEPVSSKGRRVAPTYQELSGAGKYLPANHRPLYVEVSRDSFRNPRENVAYVVDARPKPKGSVLALDRQVRVPSPEMLFLQAHQYLADLECIALGHELCGTYARQGTEEIRYNLTPCTTKERIGNFLNHIKPRQNTARARKNLAHVHNGSRSLRETQLVLMLCLPRRMGGYGFSSPILNRPFNVSKAQAHATADNIRWADISWAGASLAVEYDSNQFHSGVAKISQDATRRTLLQAAGINVIVVTNEQFKSLAELDRIAKAIAHELGIRIRYRVQDHIRRKERLHKAVLELNF